LVNGRVAACGPPAQVINEKTLAGAYGCRLLVDRSPAGPWPRVSLIPEGGGLMTED
ncbi:MAG: ABC transporter ATP-binding protein, partial [Desulfosarcina sp.]|nr:ABC transporter ATP-binding protein [Desulfosarcina sp.]MBC2767336.1 ABC transporter ATP-binding protein [Desulfosarcina sp.]